MSETAKNPRRNLLTLPLVAGAALIGLAGFVYVVLHDASKPAGADLRRFAQGGLEKLEVKAAPPAQPQTKIIDAAGQPHDLTAWRGKVVAVNFWATWCAPCVTEMPTLAALQRARGGADFAVVTVNFDRQSDHEFAQEELRKLTGGALAFYADPSFGMPFDVGAAGFPTTILYDREGREIARLAGEADWTSPEADAMIEAALKR